MQTARIKHALSSIMRGDFIRREDGSVSVEAMIVLPAIFWAFLATFSIFETFRTYSTQQKAAYTIGDAISRETVPIDNDYLDGMKSLFDYLGMARGTTSIRVTSIRYDAGEDRFYRSWSQTRGSLLPLTDEDVRDWHDKLPVMPDGEYVLLLETSAEYDPPFKIGLEKRNINNFVFTRPRYAPRVCWEECPDGV